MRSLANNYKRIQSAPSKSPVQFQPASILKWPSFPLQLALTLLFFSLCLPISAPCINLMLKVIMNLLATVQLMMAVMKSWEIPCYFHHMKSNRKRVEEVNFCRRKGLTRKTFFLLLKRNFRRLCDDMLESGGRWRRREGRKWERVARTAWDVSWYNDEENEILALLGNHGVTYY